MSDLLTDEQIVAIRDEHLPSQGEPFDCIAFARAILAAEQQIATPRADIADIRRLRLLARDALVEMSNDDPSEWTAVRGLAKAVIAFCDAAREAKP